MLKCYYTCETCDIKGNDIIHNCLSCNANYSVNFTFDNYNNCFEKCSHYYYLDNENSLCHNIKTLFIKC